MKKMHELMRKCRSLSTKLRRSSSYTSLRSKSAVMDEDFFGDGAINSCCKKEDPELGDKETIYVGRLKRRYLIKAKLLDHPLVSSLIEPVGHGGGGVWIKCEVVIFDHLLWMLENAETDITSDCSLKELAELYAY